MITLAGVTKANADRSLLLSDVSLEIPGDRRVAVFCPDPVQAKLFLQLLAGLVVADAGNINRSGRVSFLVGNVAGLDRQISVKQNVEHVARLYGADSRAVVDLCRKLSGLGVAFDGPFSAVQNSQKAPLSLAMAYCIPFDLYLHETDYTSRKNRRRIKKEVLALMEQRFSTAGFIMPSSDWAEACEVCDSALLVAGGELLWIEDIHSAAGAALDALRTEREYLKRCFGIRL